MLKDTAVALALTTCSAVSPASAAPALRPGVDVAIYQFVSNNTAEQTRSCSDCSISRRLAVGGDFSVSIDPHLLLEAGFLSTIGDEPSYPDAKLLSIRAHYLVLEGLVTPYAGAGIGYLWQEILGTFDQGTPASGDGGAAVFEGGIMLRNNEGPGRLAVCAQFILPFFSIRPNSLYAGAFPPVNVSFFLFGVKAGF